MPSLTPQEKSGDTTWAAMKDGLIAGTLALIPSSAGVYVAMKYPKFVKATNWQSRTALAIMPALFAFGFAAESKLIHRMHEMADENEHSRSVAEWAERHQEKQKKEIKGQIQRSKEMGDVNDTERQLTDLYRKSVENSGVRIVAGDKLGPHHQIANYWQENPFKILAAVGIPTVLYIFKGRSGQEHLQLQMKLMHTRVFGQFAVISLLLSLMGFKEYMDRNGKFITEQEAEERVYEMKLAREHLLERIEHEKHMKEERDEFLRKAHEQDVKEGHEITHEKKHKKKMIARELGEVAGTFPAK